MLKSLIVLITIFFTFATIDCYRDQPSSYNTGKLQSITLLNPQGGERFTADQPINVQWVSVNMTGNLRIGSIAKPFFGWAMETREAAGRRRSGPNSNRFWHWDQNAG